MNSYDTLIYSRYAPDEAQARIDYDTACEIEEQAHARYDEALNTLIVMYESHQPSATIRLQKVVVELDRKDFRRAQNDARHALSRLEQVRGR